MNTTWNEISCHIPSEFADIVAEYLAGISGSGVCVENLCVDAFSHSEIPVSASATIKSYFSSNEDCAIRLGEIRNFLDGLEQRHSGLLLSDPECSSVSSEDWSTSWKAHFKPLRVGRHLLISPLWETVEPRAGDIVLRLDPGMAFGTGGHETTRLCLELLENIMDELLPAASASVLDLGTGSGILAMAAVQLGAGHVCAVDIDPQAVAIARENLTLNGLEKNVAFSTTPLEALKEDFDIILANILAEELVRLAPALTLRLKTDGHLILSGILSEKEGLVLDGFASQSLSYRGTSRQGEWVALHYLKSSTV